MISPDFKALRMIVEANEDLQADLVRESDVVNFVARVLRLAAEHGLVIAEGMVWDAMEEGRQAYLAACSP